MYQFDGSDGDVNVEYGWAVFVQDAAGDDFYLRSTNATGIFGIGEAWQVSNDADFIPSRYIDPTFRHRDVIVTSGRRQENVQAVFDADGAIIDFSQAPGFNFPGPDNLAVDPQMTAFPENAKDVIPGTAEGLLSIFSTSLAGTPFGGQSVVFYPQYLYDQYDGLGGDDLEGGAVPLMLRVGSDPAATEAELTILVPNEDGDELEEVDITISNAEINYWSGFVSFEVTDGDDPFPVFFGLRMSYATSFVPTQAGNVQLDAGLDFQSGLHVYNLGPDSSVAINSPMVSGDDDPAGYPGTHLWIDGFNGSFDRRLQQGLSISVAAEVAVGHDVRLYGERVIVGAGIEAGDGVSIVVADSDDTSAVTRGSLLVSTAGSLTGSGGAAAPVVQIAAFDSDIDILGLVSANSQSYQFHTETSAEASRFTTRNALGQQAGSLEGNTLDVLLTNQSPVDPDDNLAHVVSLDTAVDSLRLTAADDTTSPFAPYQPFRYDVSIREEDDLSLDAVLASGEAVRISTGGDLATTASIQSQGDVTLTAGGAISGRTWITTVDGGIAIEGTDVAVEGLLQVLAPPVDETVVDIEVAATNGGIDLQGGLRAVNVVRFDQEGVGNLSASDVVAAEYLQAFADGNVTLQTDSRFIDVESAGTVTIVEANDADFRVSASGLTSLSAGGVDRSDGGSLRAALKAELRGTTNATVTAPSGSIDVTALTSSTLTIGDAAKLLDGTASSMEAAGAVSIRSTQGDVVVLDVPTAGDGVLRARAVSAASASAGNLDGTYAQNTPGLRPATLTAKAKENLNDTANFAAIFPGFSEENNPLRVRDLVLLRGQANSEQNGLYQVTNLGSATTEWQLSRFLHADTTAEFVKNTRVRITDGEFRDLTFIVGEYDNLLNSTPLQVVESFSRSADEMVVDYATDEPLDGLFSNGVITGNSAALVLNGVLGDDGIIVQDGQHILVRLGTVLEAGGRLTSKDSNGVYRKTTTGGGVWQLERLDIDPSAGVLPASEGTVVVLGGYYRTAATGKTFTVTYDGLGLRGLPIEIEADDADGDGKFTASESTILSEIGSFDPRDTTTFVVSTNGGTNDAAGSLGKMLQLVQTNVATDLSGEPVEQSVRFGNVLGSLTGATGTIVLRQELPVIDKAFEIDTATRYAVSNGVTQQIVIDGSRITSTRENTFVSRGEEVIGLEFKSGASTSLLPVPEEAAISRLSGLRLAGFETGGAVIVDGASNLLIDNLVIGLNEAGESQPVKYGIQVKGDSGKDGPVTLRNNSIFSASVFDSNSATPPLTGAGIVVEGNAQHVQIVGGVLGGDEGSNTVGVIVKSSNDDTTQANSIGVNPVPLGYLIEVATLANRATLTIPQNYWDVIGEDLHLGQTVSGTGIATGSEIIAIKPADREVILSERMLQTVTSQITFGTPGPTFITQNFFGVELQSGNVRMTNSDVANNVLDGVVVGTALPDALWAQIGAGIALDSNGSPDSKVRSAASNAIYANGRYGIHFKDGITDSSPDGGRIAIEGNYIGTNISGAAGLLNGRSGYYWDAYGSTDAEDAGAEFAAMLRQTADTSDDGRLDNSGNLNAELDTTIRGGGTGSRGSSPGFSQPSEGGSDDDGRLVGRPPIL